MKGQVVYYPIAKLCLICDAFCHNVNMLTENASIYIC